MQGLGELERMRGGDGIKYVLARRAGLALPFEHALSKIVRHTTDATVMLDRSLGILAEGLKGSDAWLQRKMDLVWSNDEGVASSALSELEALGTLLEVFPNCVPVPESPLKQTPDFAIPEVAAVEVYRPRESFPNEEKVNEELASQPGPVRIAISHPITGSDGKSLEFPASKVVDRILNSKRVSRQMAVGLPAILYVDLRHAWQLGCEDVFPYRTTFSKEIHWIGTFGAWHAFYGAKGRRTMLKDRVALRFLRATESHRQLREGFFREVHHWSASILALRDGLVLFENPWATTPLPEEVLRKLLQLHRARPEHSWLRDDKEPAHLAAAVESMLDKMEWMFRVDDQGVEPQGSEDRAE